MGGGFAKLYRDRNERIIRETFDLIETVLNTEGKEGNKSNLKRIIIRRALKNRNSIV